MDTLSILSHRARFAPSRGRRRAVRPPADPSGAIRAAPSTRPWLMRARPR